MMMMILLNIRLMLSKLMKDSNQNMIIYYISSMMNILLKQIKNIKKNSINKRIFVNCQIKSKQERIQDQLFKTFQLLPVKMKSQKSNNQIKLKERQIMIIFILQNMINFPNKLNFKFQIFNSQILLIFPKLILMYSIKTINKIFLIQIIMMMNSLNILRL